MLGLEMMRKGVVLRLEMREGSNASVTDGGLEMREGSGARARDEGRK